MEYKVDYLTLSIIPPESVECESFYLQLLHFLNLVKFKPNFKRCGGGGFYSYTMRYNDISIKVPESFNSDVQGFCIEFSGEGIDFYVDYMRRTHPDYMVSDLLKAFFSLSGEGYKTRCTRIDIAYDDIDYEEKKFYLLDLDRIERAINNLEFVSLFALKKKVKSMNVTFEDKTKGKGIVSDVSGKTIYVGNRKSKIFCRFYDKLAEMATHGKAFDKNIKHWSRLEFEFKDSRAMAICDALICLDLEHLSNYLADVINNYIRFIVVKGDISHYNRCPVKRWWAKAIGSCKTAKLVTRKPDRNHFTAAVSWVKRSVAPTLYAILQCMSFDKFMMMIKENGIERSGKQDIIIEDYLNRKPDEVFEGLEEHKYYTNDYETFIQALRTAQYHNDIRYLTGNGLDAGELVLDYFNFRPSDVILHSNQLQFGALEGASY